MFEYYQTFKVDSKVATFLLDLRKADSEIINTLAIDDKGFEAITGQKPETAEYYANVDRAYWAMVIEQVGGSWPSKNLQTDAEQAQH